MSYTHFTEENIYAIEIYIKEWYNKSQIAKKIWKCHTSIWRLIKKYSSPKTWIFHAKYCINKRKEIRSKMNKNNRNRIKNSKLENFILKYIKKYWSPEQIAWRWKKETKEKISKDTIYKYIYENHPELIKKYFRRKWKKYKHNRKEKYQLHDRKMIEFRPKEVETRERIWDWEWDTIIWKHWWSKQVILTNVDRKSWYLLARKIKDKSWNSVLDWTIELFKRIPKYKKLTMTYDNWREFCEHSMIKYLTKLDIYFAHPYSSWQRWTNENTNWLIRQFAPKKTDFEKISQNQLKYFVSLINYRPRKRLNYKTPYEVFFNKQFKLCTSC
jgi:IS30 family transposase